MSNAIPSILQKIVDTKFHEIAQKEQAISLDELKSQATALSPSACRGFANALRVKQDNGKIGIISEIKQASPSKGIIAKDFNPIAAAQGYEQAGAACLSVLTDETYFKGHADYLVAARQASGLPILRKDFMVNDYHIYESFVMGADCILLIMACLDDETVTRLHALAISLGMDVLIEIHSEDELNRALRLPNTPHNIYGINNRNLNTFKVDLKHSIALCHRLFEVLGADTLVVSESGLDNADDIRLMQSHGIGHFLIGEQFMKTDNAGKALAKLLSEVEG